jgi:predicted ATPase/DNA-binding XRE family transcriptional regulator
LLRQFRLRAGFSQEALAERAGMSPAAIWALEKGTRRHPHPRTLSALAGALGLAQADADALRATIQPDTSVVSRREPRAPHLATATPLVGREAEIEAIEQLLRRSEAPVRLLSLLGPGGVGKTRLALEVARALQVAYTDGAVFVDLTALRNPSLVIPTIAWTLGLHEQGGQSAHELLVRYLRERHLLLVLDNCEHLLGAAPQLSELLEQCPRLAMLVTSRAALRVRAERRFVVGPLATPAGRERLDPAEIAAAPAVRLFVDRACMVDPSFTLESCNADQVAAICRRLDGIPLALELAAMRVQLLSLSTLLGRLERHLALPSDGPSDLPVRQQTIRATLAWSHDLLGPAEQVLFRRLAVFVGGFTLDGAAEICADECLPADDVPTRLQALLDNSLVSSLTGSDGEPRFRMLETIREDAEERLDASGEGDVVRTRHRDWYVAWAERARPELTRRDQLPWYARLTDDLDNLRAVHAWTRQDARAAELGLCLAAALGRYWQVRAPRSEGRAWLAEALAAGPTQPTAARARALTWCGQLDYQHGDAAGGRLRLEQATAVARCVGDGSLLCLTLRHLALYTSDQATVLTLLQEAVTVARAAGDRRELAFALGYLGTAHQQRGEAALAEELFVEAVDAARASEDLAAVADALLRLGELRLVSGKYAAAQALLDEALAASQTLGYQNYTTTVTRQLAQLSLARHDLPEAHARIRTSLELARASSNGNDGLRPLQLAARLAVELGDYRRAVRLFGAVAGWQDRHDVRPGTTLWARGAHGADAGLAAARAVLGEPEFTTTWDAGRQLSLESAMDEALAG